MLAILNIIMEKVDEQVVGVMEKFIKEVPIVTAAESYLRMPYINILDIKTRQLSLRKMLRQIE